ncbi:MAG: hypothetical protein JNL26_19260 [Gemmatimonadetes bacterium]|nr:hypothetical protein [Gemmatimonadota bacterium]
MISTAETLAIAAVFDAAVGALNTGDFAAATALCDPASLRLVGRQLLGTLGAGDPIRLPTIEDLQRSSPDMPREVAEYHVAQARRHAVTGGMLGVLLPSCPSLEAAHAASPESLFAWWLEGRRDTYQIRHLEARGLAPPGTADLHQAHVPGLGLQLVVLGVVGDGPAVAHVIYRDDQGDPTTWGPDSTKWMEALPSDEAAVALDQTLRNPVRSAMCRRQEDGTYRLVASTDFLWVGSRIVARVERDERKPTEGTA